MHIDELETPVPVVDLDRMEANITRLQAYLDEHKIANRPHIKTHKIPAIAKLQMDAGAVGITCQKVSEAEVMADAGFDDIFLPYNILGESKLRRLMALAARTTLSVTADSAVTVRGLSKAAVEAGHTLPVLIECDTGAQRCGVQSPQEAAELAKLIHKLPNLHFGGLMTYPTNEYLDGFVKQTRSLLEEDGLAIERVSGGGTPCMWEAHTHPELTEHRAGIYVYGDRLTLRSGAVTLDTCALKIYATVVSRPTLERGILDAGSKTLSSDLHGLDGYGYICEYPEAKIYSLSEEHGHVDFSACTRRPEIGERVSIIPNHCCTVTSLFDQMIGARDQQVEVTWQISARSTVT
ncbi:MAG TPA: D-TA family PLP-dependent enzyme [Anaerolineales bacterium]|nr:D-TA family PLP-dependent enzyme [Anaerolineales bacterium]